MKLFEENTPQLIENSLTSNEVELNSSVNVQGSLQFTPEMKKIAQEFLEWSAENLGLEAFPSISLLGQHHKGMTYGAFDPNTNEILVYAKDRGFADVLRTAAHELTHYWQKVEGRIPENLTSRDHKLESEANTKAGDLVYMFGLEHPEIYELGFVSDKIEKPIN